MTCPACGSQVAPGSRFCANCGHALRGPDDERRIVTVLFADLVGFTSLSEQLDPERVKILIDRCFDRLAAEITSFGGRIDKIVGDAIVALFGAPVAHEDDAERAVRAALRLHELVGAEAAATGHALQLRVGVNTGEVLVGAMRAAGSITAMGDVVNTAARLQTMAEPGQVLVGQSTRDASHRAISYSPRGELALKGRAETVQAWEALAPTTTPGARRRRDDVALVGRDHELALLRHSVQAAFGHDRATIILLVADVGMGKSRLADELARWCAEELGAVVAEGRCLPYGEANVWWPVADALRGALGVHVASTEPEARSAVSRVVRSTLAASGTARGTDGDEAEVERVTSGLLNILGFECSAPHADPNNVREETGRALGVYLNALSSETPVLLQVSDLHWADDALLDLIDGVIANVAHRQVVLVATARPDIIERWKPAPGRHNAFLLHLDPLDRESSRRLLEELAASKLPDSVVDAVLDRSGGNPFFLEELVSLVDESAGERVGELPATLRGLVSARMDALEPGVRALLQDASVLGPRGPVAGLEELVRHRHGDVMEEFEALLATLVDEGILDVDGDRWSFRSDMVREVAYQTVTKADRAKAHKGIASWLEYTYGDRSPRPSWLVDQLAHHYGAAATLASELGSLADAAGVAGDLPARARRWTVASAAIARRDQAMPTAIQRYDRAIALVDLDPTATELDRAELHVLRADAAVESWELKLATESVEEIDRLAGTEESSLRAAALAIRGRIEQRRGHGDAAIDFLEQAESMYARLGLVAESSATARHLALVQIFADRPDEAECSAERARAGFEEVGDVDGQGWAAQHLAWISFVRGDRVVAEERISNALRLFDQVNDSRGQAWAQGLDAWIKFQANRVDEAAELAQRVLEEARSRRDPWATPMMMLLLASVRLWLGRTEEAVEMATESKRAFTLIGDPYGLVQSTGILGRSLVMVGRIEEGDAQLASIDAPMLRGARLHVAVQLGEPARVGHIDDQDPQTGFGEELSVARGLLALQRGDVMAAARDLRTSAGAEVEGAGSSYRRAGRALWMAAAGVDGVDEMAAGLDADLTATYLDRSVAHLAATLRAGTHDDPDSVRRHLSASRSILDATGDRVARHLHRMVAEALAVRIGAEVLGADQVPPRNWCLPGIDSIGWRRLIDLALGAVPTPTA